MKILFLSAIADFLISELQESMTPEKNSHFQFFKEFVISPEEADLVFMDYSLSEYKELFYDVLKHKQKVALIIGEDEYDNINKILYDTGVNHLFSISDDLKQLNFITDMKEFILHWNTQWGVEAFIPTPRHESLVLVTSSKDLSKSIQQLLKGHDFSHSFDDLTSYITHILEEAVPNALFHAPVNSNGQFLYRNQSRSVPVVMIPSKEVEIKLLSDSKNIVISVKDFYGSLTANNIFDYLPEEGEERKEGVKLGMYLIFRYAHKYLINVIRNESTENIIVIENYRRFKSYDMREKSFHFSLKGSK